MPFLGDFGPPPTRQHWTSSFHTLKSTLDAMNKAVEEICYQLEGIEDDVRTFGLLSEDSFLDNAPRILQLLEAITTHARTLTHTLPQPLTPADKSDISSALHMFLTNHRLNLLALFALHGVLKSTGSYYASLGRQIVALDGTMRSLWGAVGGWDAEGVVEGRCARVWGEMEEVMGEVVLGWSVEG